MRGARWIGALVAGLTLVAGTAGAATLRIGLQDDPDQLDPARSGTFVGRIVFAGLCDKLVDIDQKLNIVPQLATSWSWSADNLALTMKLRPGVVFHDGEPFDAAAVKFNIGRYKDAAYSVRKGELKPVKAVEVVGPLTVRIQLATPYAPLLAVLSDRAGMMLAPKATAEAGENVAADPVCSGPFKFAQRVAQERIVLDKFDHYWDPSAIHIDKIMYLPIPDSTVRLANLKSGQLDIVERVAATDVKAVKGDAHLRLVTSPSLAYYTMSINLANGEAASNPLGKNAKVREALEWSLDRAALNQVVFDGQFIPSNQAEAPGSKYYNNDFPVPKRDLAKAKALLKEAGQEHPSFTLLAVNNPIDQQVAQVVQSMAGEAGFEVKLQAIEQNTLIAAATKGDYQATIVLWSGRADPDGNIAIWLACDGFLNWGKWCDRKFDDLLGKARGTTVESERVALYKQASAIYLAERPHVFLYHLKWLWATGDKVEGFVPVPDGIIRLQGMRVAP
jgi:peptide/nickel transport system substrate-binding protein